MFFVLTDHEVGAALTAIEMVGRSTKPVAEIGNRSLPKKGDLAVLRRDLLACLRLSKVHQVKSYIRKQADGRAAYGFFRFSWVLNALDFCESKRQKLASNDLHWIQGLLFGYAPEAIGRFTYSLDEPASRSRPYGISSKGGKSHSYSKRFRSRSKRPGRCLVVGYSDQWKA